MRFADGLICLTILVLPSFKLARLIKSNNFFKLSHLLQDEHSFHTLLVWKVEHLPYFIVHIIPYLPDILLRVLILLLVDAQHSQPDLNFLIHFIFIKMLLPIFGGIPLPHIDGSFDCKMGEFALTGCGFRWFFLYEFADRLPIADVSLEL